MSIMLAIVFVFMGIGLACKYSDKLDELYSYESNESYDW